jgi:hypothetical protein
MLEEIWNALIEFSAQFVIPDWGALVGLIPLALLLLVILYLAWLVVRFANAGPTRRGKRRLPPVAPAGIHMPGPSFAPVLGAIGTLFLVFGLVAGGIWLLVGGVILVITLLYWGREAMRDYDHMPAAEGAMPVTGILAAPVGAPPAGVHMPPPSFRPVLAALGTTLLVAGLVVGGWLVLTGLIALAITLLGWLWDARREYEEVAEADVTGHLDSSGPPPWPKTIFASLAVLVVAGVVLGSGLIGVLTGEIDANAAPPGASGAPVGGEGSAPPAPGVEAQVVVTARNVEWVETALSAPADAPFTLALDNQDQGVPHDVAIRDAGGADVYKTEIVTGPQTVVYDVPAVPAGAYTFVCTVHPGMTGTLTAG